MELNLQSPSLLQSLATTTLDLISWKVETKFPASDKYVLIGAPHTSGWDFVFTMLFMYSTGLKMHWVGKDNLFRWPVAGLLRRLGGIPVNRRTRNNFVHKVVTEFKKRDQFVLAISPEGTRSRANYWKTGFYYIALEARVPIALGFIDYREKVVGVGPAIIPSGDIHADFDYIRSFYATKSGRHPSLQGDIKLRD